MHKGSLGIHQIELVIQSGPSFGDGCCVGDHAHSSLSWGHIAIGDDGWCLIIYAHLETNAKMI